MISTVSADIDALGWNHGFGFRNGQGTKSTSSINSATKTSGRNDDKHTERDSAMEPPSNKEESGDIEKKILGTRIAKRTATNSTSRRVLTQQS